MTTVHGHDTPTSSDDRAAGPVPEANRPGHRPETDQDKPFDKFAERAEREARQIREQASGSSIGRTVLAVAGVLALAWVTTVLLRRRRAGRVEQLEAHLGQLVHTVKDSVVDTVDTVKEWLPG